MDLIKEISDIDVGVKDNNRVVEYKKREASRCVLFNERNEIALLYVSKYDYYKLPGGGIEDGEDIIDALKREVAEEAGVNCEVMFELGKIKEYRDKYTMIQTSNCFVCRTKGNRIEQKLTSREEKQGFKLVWMNMDDAIEAMSSYARSKYIVKFITYRDTIILRQTKMLL